MSNAENSSVSPDEPSNYTFYDLATHGNLDPRTRLEVVGDMVDEHFFDFYHMSALLEIKKQRYSHEDTLWLIRSALVWGAKIGSEQPEEIINFLLEKSEGEGSIQVVDYLVHRIEALPDEDKARLVARLALESTEVPDQAQGKK